MKASVRASENGARGCPKTGRPLPRRRRWLLWAFPFAGIVSLVWFLMRVIPKPSRAAYPCQRIAAPVASSFVLWLLGATGAVVAFRGATRRLCEARYALAAACALIGLAVAAFALIESPAQPAAAALWTPSDAPNTPIGVARGINPGRVVWVHNPNATAWDGSHGHWWDDRSTSQTVADAMISQSVQALTGETTDAAAWDALFRSFNQAHGRGNLGYQLGEQIAIKINLNASRSYSWGNGPTPSPHAVRALLWQLVHQAGVPEAAITIFDCSRPVADPIYSRCHAEFPNVHFVDSSGGTGRTRPVRSTTRVIYSSAAQRANAGATYLPACAVDAAYFIDMALLKGHEMAGVTLCGKNLFGCVWHSGDWTPSAMHSFIPCGSRPMGSYSPIVDLMGHESLGGRTLLYLVDGLYGAVNQDATPTRWRSAPFNSDWTSSLFVSQDGVAIDSVALDFQRSEPTLASVVHGSADNYLHEAALAGSPPSGTFYDPEGDGTRLASLGVHEHWNNAANRQYSRNLGTGNGIELVTLDTPLPSVGFASAASSVLENAGTCDVTVSLSTASTPSIRTVSVPFAAAGTARRSVDYTVTTRSPLVFAPGQTSQVVHLTLINNTKAQGARTVVLSLGAPTNAPLGPITFHTLTIRDDELLVQFAAAARRCSESAGTFHIPVTLAGPTSETVTVDYAVTGGTATGGGVDYTLAPGQLTFAPGETTKDILVGIVDDLDDEPHETVIIALSNPANALLGSRSVHTLTIIDNDGPQVPVLEVVSGGDLDFGAVPFGSVKTMADAYTVRNAGDVPLDGTVSVETPFHVFDATNAPTGKLAFRLDPAEERKLSFDFAPLTPGPVSKAIQFNSTGGDATHAASGQALPIRITSCPVSVARGGTVTVNWAVAPGTLTHNDVHWWTSLDPTPHLTVQRLSPPYRVTPRAPSTPCVMYLQVHSVLNGETCYSEVRQVVVR